MKWSSLDVGYPRHNHRVGILHFGIGAFHRAHQAVYTDAALRIAGGDWRIVAVNLRSTDIVDTLNAQDGVYSVIERDRTGSSVKLIGSIARALSVRRDYQTVMDHLADPNIRIVTITVTEKAYGTDRQTGKVDPAHAAIADDLAQPDTPHGLIGLLVRGLWLRHMAGVKPFTIVSCDNLPSNGVFLRSGVIDFARRVDPALAIWIEGNVSFPSTMVDRITPAPTEKTVADIARLTELPDQAGVETEPFSQWVIEDTFPTGRPAWDQAGGDHGFRC